MMKMVFIFIIERIWKRNLEMKNLSLSLFFLFFTLGTGVNSRGPAVLLRYCHDAGHDRGGGISVEAPRHVYEFIAPFVPGPGNPTDRYLPFIGLFVIIRYEQGGI